MTGTIPDGVCSVFEGFLRIADEDINWSSCCDELDRLGFDLFAIDKPAIEYWPCPGKGRGNRWRLAESTTTDVFGMHALRSFVQIDRGVSKLTSDCTRLIHSEFLGVPNLHSAALLGNYSEVQNLLANSHPNLTEQTFQGQTALHLAISDPYMVECLIQNGFLEHVEVEDAQGLTPLMYAAICDCVESAQVLLNAGASPFRKDTARGLDMWVYGVEFHRIDFIIQMLSLLGNRTSPSVWKKVATQCAWEYALRNAIAWFPGKQLLRLLDSGADDCFTSDLGNSFLHLVARPVDGMALLTRNPQHINQNNSAGCTPLMVFSSLSNPDLLQLAISLGADVDSVDQGSLCSLHYLVLSVVKDVVEQWMHSQWNNWPEEAFTWLQSGAVLLANGASILQSDTCSCACSADGCSPLRMLFSHAPHHYNGPSRIIATTPFILEWYLLVHGIQGQEASSQAAACWYRLQKFDELGMVHTCCTTYLHTIRHPVYLEKPLWEPGWRDRQCENKQAEEGLQEAEIIQEEQQHLRSELERECDGQSSTNWYGLLKPLARRVVMMEEGFQKQMDDRVLRYNDEEVIWVMESLETVNLNH